MEYDDFLVMMHDITEKIPEELSNNRELVIDVVRKNGLALQYVSEQLRDDDIVVKIAVENNGMALQFASHRLQNIHHIVMSAVLENGWALQFASDTLRDNSEIVTCAMWTHNDVVEYASDDIKIMQTIEHKLVAGKEIQNHYDYDAKIPKAKRFSYAKIKELYTEAQEIRSELHKNQSEEVLERLDLFIDEIRKTTKSSSSYLNSDEVQSDLEWIIEYYEKKEWLNVTRWLSNIDGSLRDMWSDYMDKLKKAHGENPSASANFQ